MVRIRSLTLVFVFMVAGWIALPALGQSVSNYLVEHFSTEDGLPSNAVLSVYQDRFGYILIGTSKGAVRFDGFDFVPLSARDTTVEGAPDDLQVTAFLEDQQGNLYAGGSQGIGPALRYTRFGQVKSGPAPPFGDYVKALGFASPDSTDVWVAGSTGLSRWHLPDRFESVYPIVPTIHEPDGIKPGGMLVEEGGDVWFGAWGLRHFDAATGEIISFLIDPRYPHYRESDWPHSHRNDVFAVAGRIADPATVWVGARGGLYRFDTSSHEFKRFLPFADTSAVLHSPSQMVTALHEDGSGRLWVGTRRGVYLFDPETERFTAFAALAELRDINSVYEDRQGVIWVASASGLSRITPPAYPFTMHDRLPDHDAPFTYENVAITEDMDGTILVDHPSGYVRILPGSWDMELVRDARLAEMAASGVLLVDSSGMLWDGGRGGLFAMTDRPVGSIASRMTRRIRAA